MGHDPYNIVAEIISSHILVMRKEKVLGFLRGEGDAGQWVRACSVIKDDDPKAMDGFKRVLDCFNLALAGEGKHSAFVSRIRDVSTVLSPYLIKQAVDPSSYSVGSVKEAFFWLRRYVQVLCALLGDNGYMHSIHALPRLIDRLNVAIAEIDAHGMEIDRAASLKDRLTSVHIEMTKTLSAALQEFCNMQQYVYAALDPGFKACAMHFNLMLWSLISGMQVQEFFLYQGTMDTIRVHDREAWVAMNTYMNT